MKFNNILKVVGFALFVFLTIITILIYSFPWLKDLNSVQNQLFQTITDKTQVDISSEDIDIDLFPEPALKLKDLTVKSKDGGIKFFSKTIIIYPDLKQLFKGELILDKIVVLDSDLCFTPEDKENTGDKKGPNIPIPSNIFNLLETLQIHKYMNKNKGFVINIQNFKHDFAQKIDLQIQINGDKIVAGEIAIKNLVLKKKFLDKYGFNGQIFNLHSQNDNDLVSIHNFNGKFKITPHKAQITADPIIFTYPSMTLGINFSYNYDSKKAFIKFTGKDVEISQAKAAYFDLFNKEDVSENLFDVVRAGNASKITVLFKENRLKDLFRPENMVLKGQLEHGNIKIPNTPLIPEDVYGSAVIKKGVLYITADKAHLQNSDIYDGTLTIDLLNSHDFPFSGTFGIHAPLSDLKNILTQLFDDTILARELKILNNVKGFVKGELKLELRPEKKLNVTVITEDITGSGQYPRMPGKIKINGGRFQYKDEIITLTDFSGKIGKSYYYDLSGSYKLDDTRMVNITSARALIDSGEAFNWLTGFDKINQIVPDLIVDKGFIKIDSLYIKGDVLAPDELQFNAAGSLYKSKIRLKSKENGISLSSCNFNISNQILSFKDINAEVSDIDLISNFTLNKKADDIATPFIVTNALFKSFENKAFFQSELNFPGGPVVNLEYKKYNDSQFYLKNLSVKDGQITDVTFLTDKYNKIDFLKFTGQISTKTLEKLFNEKSYIIDTLNAYSGKKNIIINSNKEGCFSIFSDTLDLELIFDQLFNKNKITKDFTNKHIEIKTDLLKYKKSFFNDYTADLSIQKKSNKYQGVFNCKSKQGKIQHLTLLSRILSVINITTYFKGKFPDFLQTGFKYHSISIESNIVDNIFTLEKAVIDGHDMALVFTGTIDIKKNNLDLTCLVAPFKTIDILVKNIPVVNKMLNNTLISIPVKISGNIDDPVVVPLHPGLVGKRTIHLLTGIIKSPFKLLGKLSVNSSIKGNDKESSGP